VRVGQSYKQVELRGPFDVIVVGSGIGGLTCASLLARHAGKRVLVLERHYTAGGFTHSFERPGYDWDVGVHYIGQMHSPNTPMRRLFDHLTDGQLEWSDLGEVYDEIDLGGERFEFVRGRTAFRKRMHGYFPRERSVIDDYLELTRRAAKYSELYFLDRGMPQGLAELAGPLLRAPAARYARTTTLEVFKQLGASPKLVSVLTGNFGDYGLPPSQSSFLMQALLAEHYRHGAAYPVGGASRIASTIVPSIERAGGAVITSAPVAQILVEKGRAVGVRLESGEDIRAPIVVSDAGVRLTFERLLSHEIRAELGLYEPLREISASVSSVTLYLGFEGTPAELGMPRHNLWLYPHGDHDRGFGWVTGHAGFPPRSEPLPVAYCSFAAARDPDFARRHPGHSTAEVITVSNNGWFRAWQDTPWHRRGEAYERTKQAWTERLLEPLLKRLPQLQSRIRHSELSTPLSTRHFASHPDGEIYGLVHSPARFTHRRLRADTPIRGLFLAGSDVVTCGVAGGAAGGVVAASRILASDVRGLFRRRPATTPGYVKRRAERSEPHEVAAE
jgi:all-trans-retinol 13,14-reductase